LDLVASERLRRRALPPFRHLPSTLPSHPRSGARAARRDRTAPLRGRCQRTRSQNVSIARHETRRILGLSGTLDRKISVVVNSTRASLVIESLLKMLQDEVPSAIKVFVNGVPILAFTPSVVVEDHSRLAQTHRLELDDHARALFTNFREFGRR